MARKQLAWFLIMTVFGIAGIKAAVGFTYGKHHGDGAYLVIALICIVMIVFCIAKGTEN